MLLLQRYTFDRLKSYTMDGKYENEFCGYISFIERGECIFESIIVGEVEGQLENNTGRRMCQYEKLVRENLIRFHTHPLTSYAYPSAEDISHVLKKNTREAVFTLWGLWIITHIKKLHISDYRNRKDRYTDKPLYYSHFKEFGDFIAKDTSTDRYSKKKGMKSRIFDDRVYRSIKKYINGIEKYYGENIKIKFFDYETLEKMLEDTGNIIIF